MRKFIILAMILALATVGCATTSQQTTTDKEAWDKIFSEKQVAEAINQLRYESGCNKLVMMYVFGESLVEIEKDKGYLGPAKVLLTGREFSNRIATETSEQRALLEMFAMGYIRAPFDKSTSPEMKTCLETEASRMQKYHEVKLKQVLEEYAKQK